MDCNIRKVCGQLLTNERYAGLSMEIGFPWESQGKCPMGWDSTHCMSQAIHGIVVEKLMVEKLPELTELSLSETMDEQIIENLLNEHGDSECECQNDNKLWTLLNFIVYKVNIFCRFVVQSSTYYTRIFINLLTFIALFLMGWDERRQAWTAVEWDGWDRKYVLFTCLEIWL